MLSAFDKFAFNATQAARISWFFGQKLLAARMGRSVPVPDRLKHCPTPDRRRILADLRALLAQDWRNIEAGYYAPPADGLGSPFGEIRRAVDFFADLEAVEQRRHGRPQERFLTEAAAARYPA